MSETNLHLSNPFAALEVRKAKKKKAVDTDRRKRGAAKAEQQLRLEQEIFAKRQPNVSDWADDDDEEWGGHPVMADATNGKGPGSELHESEEEIDLEEHFGFELRKEDDHEEHEEKDKQETSTEPSAEELALLEEHRKRFHAQPQRKVSKKELKKKEMEDLDGLLADLGIDVNEDQKTSESSSKKKKKKNKDKSGGGSVGGAGGEDSVEAAVGAAVTQTTPPEQQEQPQQQEEELQDEEEQEDTQSSSLTPEQIRLKLEKTKSGKKRTTSKKSIEIAAAEAKARSKGKKGKKDATHYNQVRASMP